jgi:hypothetical protein
MRTASAAQAKDAERTDLAFFVPSRQCPHDAPRTRNKNP